MAKSSQRGSFHSENVSVFLAELLGTALLVFLGCSSCISWTADGPSGLQVILSFGIAVLICVQIFGCVSGSHINPAVTIAALIYKSISVQKALAYFVAQCLGAFMGYGLLVTLTPDDKLGKSLCVTKPHPSVSTPQALAIEFIATLTLVWICCGIWDPRNSRTHDSVPIRFGLAVTGLASASGPFTGGSFNPARSLGPALWNQDFESHWIYWVAPMSGAIVAAVVYKYVFYREVIETEDHGRELQSIE